MRSIEVEGSSIDDAIARALSALRVERDRVAIEILSNSTRGVFGLGSRRARIRATVREPQGRVVDGDVSRETPTSRASEVSRGTFDGEPEVSSTSNQTGPADRTKDRAPDILRALLGHMEVQCDVEPVGTSEDGAVVVAVRGLETGLVIGRQGQTLDAIEYLLNRIIGRDRDQGTPPRVVIDVEGYRERRQESLEQLARRMAANVRKTGRVEALNPMSPRDRRIVHLALDGDPAVTTRSEGDGHYRRVLIVPRR
jgi:spoIIIJ-associated protein